MLQLLSIDSSPVGASKCSVEGPEKGRACGGRTWSNVAYHLDARCCGGICTQDDRPCLYESWSETTSTPWAYCAGIIGMDEDLAKEGVAYYLLTGDPDNLIAACNGGYGCGYSVSSSCCGSGSNDSGVAYFGGCAMPTHEKCSASCLSELQCAFSNVYTCMNNIQSPARTGEGWNEYGTHISKCCDNLNPEEDLHAWKRHPNCMKDSILMVGLKGSNQCDYGACCSNWEKPEANKQSQFTIFGSNLLVDDLDCWRMIVAAMKLYQCCALTPATTATGNLSYEKAEGVTKFIASSCCCKGARIEYGIEEEE